MAIRNSKTGFALLILAFPLLLKADVNARNAIGMSALDIAKENGFKTILLVLEKTGAK